jgi:hypothetical protein
LLQQLQGNILFFGLERLDKMLSLMCSKAGVKQGAIAADATGFDVSRATPYFEMRRGGRRKAYN